MALFGNINGHVQLLKVILKKVALFGNINGHVHSTNALHTTLLTLNSWPSTLKHFELFQNFEQLALNASTQTL